MAFQKNKLCTAVAVALFGAALAACGGHHHHHGGGGGGNDTNDWSELEEGQQAQELIELIGDLPEMSDECKVAAGQAIVSGEIQAFDKYGAWLWGHGNLYPEWPGKEITDNIVEACAIKTRYINIPDVEPNNEENPTLDDGWSGLINDFGGGNQTVDVNGLNQKKACIKLSEEKDGQGKYLATVVSPRECGVHVDGMPELDEVPIDVYLSFNDRKYADGDTIDFTEVAGNDDSKAIEVSLLLKGENINEETSGFYWFNDDEKNKVEFKNSQKVKIGEKIKLEDGDQKEGTLHISYTPKDAEGNDKDPVTAAITITKNYTAKDEEGRMKELEPEETLGAIYTNEKTTFRIWSPDSADVKVNVDGTDYEMKPVQLEGYTKVYEVVVEGDLAGKTYQFSVKGNKVRDPYGRMTAKGSDTANIVMNLDSTDPEDGWITNPREFKNREDAVVYEVHVRDFTIDPTSGVDEDKRGRYLGMVQEGTMYEGFATGIDHLKKLGVTHVQLQPIYDYATCSDVDSQDNSCYNWGYDPWNYNVPEDRYTSVFGTDNYEQKIREVKEMINMFHKNGIRVIMDVVYNHTFDKSVFEKITDKYYMGNNDLSGCGNAINADNNMVWMMIRDSLDYWVTEYHVDGFRLDLAGVFGIKDFSDWGVYLNKRHPDANLLIYGEPWTGGGDATAIKDPVRTGRMFMQDPDAHVGAFNNRIRNCLKSASDRSDSEGNTSRLGFIFNQLNTDWDTNGTDENGNALEGNKECVFMSVKAGVRTENAPAEVVDEWSAQGFSDPEQAVSYITAHDNLALRDKIERASIDGNVLYNEDEVKTIQAYANSIIMVSQGIAFIHGGEEMGRTKKAAGESGESPMWNTYKTTSGANDFQWNLLNEGWAEVSETYGDYIKMRSEHPAFRMTTAELINKNVTLDEASTDEVVIININGEAVNDEWGTIKVVMNSKDTEVEVAGVAEMTKVADGKDVGNVTQNGKAAPRAVSIWVTENENYCEATQRFDSLYLVGSFPASNWSTFIPLSRYCKGTDSGWTTTEPVALPEGAEFLFFEKSGDWNSTKVGYDSSNATQKFCTAGGHNEVLEGGIAQDCAVQTLTEGAETSNVKPDDWTPGVSLGGSYMIDLHENDLTMKLEQEAQ
jgi:pullulanase/glycogen debranching enzyme